MQVLVHGFMAGKALTTVRGFGFALFSHQVVVFYLNNYS